MAKDEKNAKTTQKKREVKSKVPDGDKTVVTSQVDAELYEKVVKFEEDLARSRDADADTHSYLIICEDISKLLLEIAALKTSEGDNANEIRSKQTQVTLKIMSLKKLNRLEKVRTKDCRQELQTYREQVDSDNLHLQNLIYEQLHLSKEVAKCYDFKSVDEDMDLISVDEFFATAPASVSKPAETQNNPHNLKLARLAWELMQRKNLASKLKKLEADKEAVAKSIELKKDQLSNLEPNLRSVLESTKPLQDILGIPLDKTKKLQEIALLLPKPLFVLFVQAEAYSRLAKWISVSVSGKADDIGASDHHFDDISSADSDSDDGEHTRRRKILTQDRRKSGGSGITETSEQRRYDCLKRHPLCVDLKVTLRDGNSVVLQFQWLSVLEIVCVHPTVSVSNSSGLAAADLLSPMAIFASLFPGDVGGSSPNPSTYYHLQRACIESFPMNVPNLGIPYLWAQTLCGITFIADASSISLETSRHSLETTLIAIRSRLRGRIALANEVKCLESGECFRDKNLQARLLSFTAVTVSDLQRDSSAAPFLEKGVIDETYLAYRASIDVHDAKLTAYITLAPSYPSHFPIISLELQRKKLHTAATCNHIRDLEREVNTVVEENADEGILTRQMYKLLLCSEILIATEFPTDRPVKATFYRALAGRARNHPYHYNKTAGGIFTHRS